MGGVSFAGFVLLALDHLCEGGVVHVEEGTEFLVLLVDDSGVLEVVDQLGGALDACVADLADFLRVEFLPPLMMELLVEFADELGMDEVDEGIAYIALVLSKRESTR